jgi:hypothetical protein
MIIFNKFFEIENKQIKVININHLQFEKINWEDRCSTQIHSNGGIFDGVKFVVDVTECELQNPIDFQKSSELWSGKSRMPALKYESM